MTTALPAFVPTTVLEPGIDPVTRERFASRLSTTVEQAREAVDHALAWMLDHRVWIVELEVQWSRREPSVLTVRGHAEHVTDDELVAVLDELTERDLDGHALAQTPAERQVQLESELTEIYVEGLE